MTSAHESQYVGVVDGGPICARTIHVVQARMRSITAPPINSANHRLASRLLAPFLLPAQPEAGPGPYLGEGGRLGGRNSGCERREACGAVDGARRRDMPFSSVIEGEAL